MRGRSRDDARYCNARGDDHRLERRHPAWLRDLRPDPRQRPGQDAGTDRRRALRPVRRALRDRLHGDAVLAGRRVREGRRRAALTERAAGEGRLLHVSRARAAGAARRRGGDEVRARVGDRALRSRHQHRAQQGRPSEAGPQADPRAPVRVAIQALGINAPVSPTGINVAKGELDANPSVGRTSWWRDGAAPGATAGTVLIAGHVDSATQGPGAFYRLKEARVGDQDHGHLEERREANVPCRLRADDAEGAATAGHLLDERSAPPRARHVRRAVPRGAGPLPRQRRRDRRSLVTPGQRLCGVPPHRLPPTRAQTAASGGRGSRAGTT